MSMTLKQHQAKAQAIIVDMNRQLVIQSYRGWHRALKTEIKLAMQNKRYSENKAKSSKPVAKAA